MIMLVTKKAKPALGLDGSIFRPKTKLRGVKAFILLFSVLKIRLNSFQHAEIHWDIILLEISGCRGLVHLLILLHIVVKCIQA